MPLVRPAIAALATLLAAVPLAGCGSGATARAHDRAISIRLDDFLISPQRVVVPAGRLTISAHNAGAIGHNLRIRRHGRKKPLPGVGIDTLYPGHSGKATVTLKPGTYDLVCTIPRHEDLGQYGTLIVKRSGS